MSAYEWQNLLRNKGKKKIYESIYGQFADIHVRRRQNIVTERVYMKHKHCCICGEDLGLVYGNKQYCQECATRRKKESIRISQHKVRVKGNKEVEKYGDPYTAEEDQYILRNYVPRRYTILELSRDLKRTYCSVSIRLSRLRKKGRKS